LKTTSSAIYLLGRYRKYARDVPQAAWIIGDERKGRHSIEEIINHVVTKTLRGTNCKMHSCGREDIDVRCLGNGRPFIIEIMNALEKPTEEKLLEIMNSISLKQDLNSEGDIEVTTLKESDKSVWESMQTIAEEKKKAYRCVVWSSKPLSKSMVASINTISNTNVDDDGSPCLQIIQKTPLRVLHRRSLLDRKRNIYDIETTRLNDHYFLLTLTTSAGTYVKEFVHGDMGRTVPSISSILNCNCDILQLDVIWLYDNFEGGGDMYKSNSSSSNSVGINKRVDGESLSLADLDNIRIASINNSKK
jgi:tRNA pseudouridine synthase 10